MGRVSTELEQGKTRLKKEELSIFHLILEDVTSDPSPGSKWQWGGHACNSAIVGKNSMQMRVGRMMLNLVIMSFCVPLS